MNHYTADNQIKTIEELKQFFPNGKCNEINLVLFSTSGIHGTYQKIEDICFDGSSEENTDYLTVLVIQPRKVCMAYGEIKVSEEDVEYLKMLRKSSRDEFCKIG